MSFSEALFQHGRRLTDTHLLTVGEIRIFGVAHHSIYQTQWSLLVILRCVTNDYDVLRKLEHIGLNSIISGTHSFGGHRNYLS